MGTANLHHRKISHPGWLTSLARRLVLEHLESLPHGRLTIVEPDGNTRVVGDSEPAANLVISDWRTYRMMLTGGALGAAEAFIEGGWESADLTNVIRYFAANVDAMQVHDRGGLRVLAEPARRMLHHANRNSMRGSRRNISAHYDLGNDFFGLFLDQRMMYSSAIFPTDEAGLEEASEHKLDVICRKLDLSADTHLLEVGTGWGGLAIHAARHYGCRVTTTTISREQFQYARREVKQLGLEDRVEVLDKDYRELSGTYDRVVSVEMIEAVGHEFLPTYFRKLGELLAEDGLLLIQAITIPAHRYEGALKNVDFIKKYVFPGGFLPSVNVMLSHLGTQTRLSPVHLDDIGLDYARTLAIWRERFVAAREAVREQGFDRRFRRLWLYYLCYCEGAFLERAISTVQLLAAGPRHTRSLTV
jgi:cyclopropane-fatty-acyl-phospholipid synthase